jgi:HTH-type transcriptional regulator/antitoxin HigA
VIKSESQYRAYLEEIEALAIRDPEPDSEDGARLELLALIVEAYEKERSQLVHTDPVDAIVFRMEQQDLQQKDLVPYMGSKSRVSEVLSGKRPLSLNMIRSLSEGLGIPAKALISKPQQSNALDGGIDWSKFPLREMSRRGWLPTAEAYAGSSLIDAVKVFFNQVGGQGVGPAYCRRTTHFGGDVSTDFYALNAWIARVVVRSRESARSAVSFSPIENPAGFLREVARLSSEEQGPLLAQKFLREHGIRLVVERHLPRTRLDGAALLDLDGTPVIGLTFRYDRADNFWFTLLHEVAHVVLHLESKQEVFVDNTYVDPDGERKETEANNYAQEALIPRTVWRRSDAYRLQTLDAVKRLAADLKIHPAIVAGRLRRDTGNYKKFSSLVNNAKVSHLFLR